MALFRDLFAAVGCLTVIVVVAAVGWLYRDDLRGWWAARDRVEAVEPSPELADRAAAKLEFLVDGSGPAEVRLSGAELQSYLRYRLASGLPAGVSDPAVELRDSTLELSVALQLSRLAEESAAAENLRRFFGDSARVRTELQPRVGGEGVGHLTVLSLQAGLVPVPPLFIPNVLGQAGFQTVGGRTIIFPIPPELREIRIEDQEVVLRREP